MNFRYILRLLVLLMTLPFLVGCHEVETYDNDIYGNFDCLWQTVNDRYCFFEEKNVDWAEVGDRYRALLKPGMTNAELFVVCRSMLDELKDGHVNLSAPFATSYYRKWWTDYPQDFNWRTVAEYYLDFGYLDTSGMSYDIVGDNIGYLRYPSFSTTPGNGNLDYVLGILGDTNGLIIDVRDNGGGLLTNVERIVSRFITKKTLGGWIRHKTGPGHDEFSEPYAIQYDPADDGRVKYLKPVVVLTNRSCFSAANDFVAVMKSLPQVKIVGATTGGGGGLPFTAELPNGWSIRFSACPITDPQSGATEFGITPSPGCELHAPDAELAEGRDAILDFAINLLTN